LANAPRALNDPECCISSSFSLTYAGVTAAATGRKVFRELIIAEKKHGLPLVAEVKPGNKSDMAMRLHNYKFRPWSDFTYRWDPE
jgi:hypothetical protein